MSTISVIVPVYKVEPYLNRCVDSILNQTYKDFELILVDDGSPDKCPSICDEYGKKDERVIVIHKENGGLSSARNAGLDFIFANSNSKYVSFVDSDDWVDERYLEILYKIVVDSKYGISCCALKEVFDDTIDMSKNKTKAHYNVISIIEDECFSNNFVSPITCAKMIDKYYFKNLRFVENRTDEDNFIFHRLIGKAGGVSSCRARLYYYYRHKGTITFSRRENEVTVNFLDIWVDRLNYYTFEHPKERLAFENFMKTWRELKHCLVNRIVKYCDYKNSLKILKKLYITKYRSKQKYYFLNIVFLYFPRSYIFIHKLVNK